MVVISILRYDVCTIKKKLYVRSTEFPWVCNFFTISIIIIKRGEKKKKKSKEKKTSFQMKMI